MKGVWWILLWGMAAVSGAAQSGEEYWMTVGGRAGMAVSFYGIPGAVSEYKGDTSALGFEGGATVGVNMLPFLGFQVEMVFLPGIASLQGMYADRTDLSTFYYGTYTDTYRYTVLMVPMLLRVPLERNGFSVAFLAGIYLNAPLGAMEFESTEAVPDAEYQYLFSPAIGITAGLELGYRLGPGVLLGGIRFGEDLGVLRVERGSKVERGVETEFNRRLLSVYAGYSFLLLKKSN
jgi:hypothetical protein